ncbi:signal transduction histidine kinase [Microcella putealis]|uniref:histidine kinase n=1 Tax=Microcella putealis TaxID=337005 RepID=A0A4Q7LV03_9MICO|nr:sensor histidine kinase [Microcella putealis]RZS57748.1 signal transduction histidine kinase [Microcella putealis]TQM24815.1 signal transduction histidine kinase [Microcella putealis]
MTTSSNPPSGTSTGVPDGLALPRPPGVVRRYLHAHPWVTDSLVAAAYVLVAAIFVVIAAVAPGAPALGLVVAMTVAGAAVVTLRRRFPLATFAIANVLLIAGAAVGTAVEIFLPLITIYAIGVYRSTRTAWVSFVAGAAAAALASVVGAVWAPNALIEPAAAGEPTLSLVISGTITGIAVLLIATLIGTNVGSRNRYVAALVERAAQLARERDAQAEIARGLERERIAREMHDVIAHSLSVMIALSEGARAAAPEHPENAQRAMERAADTGRRTLGEVRRMLGTVRGDDAPPERAPQPAISDLGALIAAVQGAGLPVTVTTRGTPHADPALELTVYRVVQESLTNTLRHGSRVSRARVALDWGDEAVTVTVSDDGAVPSASSPAVGRGLIGMRERVALFGGELTAGPGPARGWRVSARIPLDRSSP